MHMLERGGGAYFFSKLKKNYLFEGGINFSYLFSIFLKSSNMKKKLIKPTILLKIIYRHIGVEKYIVKQLMRLECQQIEYLIFHKLVEVLFFGL